MLTIKQIEEIIKINRDTKSIKYIDENKNPIEPNQDSIVEDIEHVERFNGGPFGGYSEHDYIITIKNESNLKNHLDNPQKTLEKHFKISEETGYYYGYKPDLETICKDFKIYNGTPTLHPHSKHNSIDYRITIFKQDDIYYAYIIEIYNSNTYKNSYIIKNKDYLNLLQDLNEKIYSQY